MYIILRMAPLFYIEGSGFYIAIAITLILIGALVYYFDSRISLMERAIVKQNQVLGDFITNVRNSLAKDETNQTQSGGSSKVALDVARKQYAVGDPAVLIPVSDDSSEEDDDSSEEDDASVIIEDINPIKANTKDADSAADIVEIFNSGSDTPTTPPSVKTIRLGDIKTEKELEEVASCGSLGTASVLSSNTSSKESFNTSTTASSTSKQTTNEEDSLKKMKLNDLRDMAIKSGALTSAVAKKMKKDGLINAINNFDDKTKNS